MLMESGVGRLETLLDLEVTFSKDAEAMLVQNGQKYIEWCREHGYVHILPPNVGHDTSPAEIYTAIEDEWDESIYQKAEAALRAQWLDIKPQLIAGAHAVGLSVPQTLTVALTRYGTGGMFRPPSTVIVRFVNNASRMRDGAGLCATVAHETIHILIDSYIQKYNVSHWCKESLVDALMERWVPGFAHHKGAINTECDERVSGACALYYPGNIDALIKVFSSEQ